MVDKKEWKAAYGKNDFAVLKDEVLADSFYQLREVTVRHKTFSGDEITIKRDLFKRPSAVGVLLYDVTLDAVVLVEQFRIGALVEPQGPWLLEIVAGIVEPCEEIAEVATRECYEESGLHVQTLEHLFTFSPSPGGSEENVDLFCALVDARNAGGVHGLATEGEDIKVHVLDALEALAMLNKGQISNSFTIIALQWLALNRARLQKQAE